MKGTPIPLDVSIRFSCRAGAGCPDATETADADDEHHLLSVIAEARRLRQYCGHCGCQDIENEITIRRLRRG